MAANRFATMLHRNTNKVTLILTYAVLEWILIGLLLWNSLFSYLIVKFAEFFGLKPPCPWCTRVDHLFDSVNGDRKKMKMMKNINMDLLCEVHSKRISELGFCSNHRKLVDSRQMCEDCSLSRPETMEVSSRNSPGLVGQMEEFGDCQSDENGVVSLGCSCCGVSLGNANHHSSDRYSSYILLKTSSWDAVLECAHKQNLITESGDYDLSADNGNVLENKSENRTISEFEGNLGNEEKDTEERGDKEIMKEEHLDSLQKDKSVLVCVEEDAPLQLSSEHLEFFLDYSGNKLVPVELNDLVTEEHMIEEDDVTKNQEVDEHSEVQVEVKEEVVVESRSQIENTFLDFDLNEEPTYELPDSMEIEEDGRSLFFQAKDSHLETEVFKHFLVFPLAQCPTDEAGEVPEPDEKEKHSDIQTACEEASQGNNESEADVSIGTEIPDLDITDEIPIQDSNHSFKPIHEDTSTNSPNLSAINDHGSTQVEEQISGTQSLSVHDGDNIANNKPSVQMELKETEEDKVPYTPTSMESLNMDKNLLFEKRFYRTEESLDGSITSELDGGDVVVTIESLKSALRSERKTLRALYTELEEERSASAVATNQTMAMINRLQEEKAAMQMEALQYQRMMEEQSEYDQEALQLLNELMVKREKEKQELERELEVYRRKLLVYDIKEKTRVLRKSRDGSFRSGFSSACSNADDSDGLSVDLNQEVKEEDGIYGNSDYTSRNTPEDAVVNLEESLKDFEEERLSILEQLQVLEEKLLMLDDENEQSFVDAKEMDENGDHSYGESESNGYSNGKHHYKRSTGQKGKSLLPLFDAISDENEDLMMVNGNMSDHDSYAPKFEMEGNKKVAIEEEVDHLYERLQALEADREFLKHCISSLKKGDKGMYLLQEILQHLRDLRRVDHRVRNFGDGL